MGENARPGLICARQRIMAGVVSSWAWPHTAAHMHRARAAGRVHAVMVYDIATGNVHDVIMEDRWGAGRPDQQRFPGDLCMPLVRAMAMTANGRWLILATQTPAVDRYWVYDLEARAFATSLAHPAAPGRQVPLDEAVPVFCELKHSESRPVDTCTSRQQHTANQEEIHEIRTHPQRPEPQQRHQGCGHSPGQQDPQQQQQDQQQHPLLLTAQRGPGGSLGPVWVWDLASGQQVAELRVSCRTPHASDSIGGASGPGGGLQLQPHIIPAPPPTVPGAAVCSAPPASGAAHLAREVAVAAASPAVALSCSADGSRLYLLNAAGQLALWDLVGGQALLATAAAQRAGAEALTRDGARGKTGAQAGAEALTRDGARGQTGAQAGAEALTRDGARGKTGAKAGAEALMRDGARGKTGAQAGAEALMRAGTGGSKEAEQAAPPAAAAAADRGPAAAPGTAAVDPEVWCNGFRCSRPPRSATASTANAQQRLPRDAEPASSPCSCLSQVAWPRHCAMSSNAAYPNHRTTTPSAAGTFAAAPSSLAAAAVRELGRREDSSSGNPRVEWLSVPLASDEGWPDEGHQRLVLPCVADAVEDAATFSSGRGAVTSEDVLGASEGQAMKSGACTRCLGRSAAGVAVVLSSVPPMWVWREVRCVAADWRAEVA